MTEKEAPFKLRPSLLSSDASAENFRGMVNLALLVLVLSNLRVIIMNLLKYGVLLRIEKFYITEWQQWPGLLLTLSLLVYPIAALFIEQAAAKGSIDNKKTLVYNTINLTCTILIPSSLVWIIKPNPASGLVVMLFTAVFWMKLVSYAQVNYDLRKLAIATSSSSTAPTQPITGWPHNLTLKNMLYFLAVPTLCYNLEYPRTPSIRWSFLLKRTFEGILLSLLIVVIVEQHIVPVVHESLTPLSQYDLVRVFERLLMLSIPNLVVWLLGFYVLFHVYLNILAEVFRFGDRFFYQDWWNSTSLSQFWTHWNYPVHLWMARHVYSPSRRLGYSKSQAVFFCFLISAFFHEVKLN